MSEQAPTQGSNPARSPAKVSVIVPCYNAEKTIEESLDSIFSQKYKDYDVTIVDDGSSDSTPEILKKYQGENVTFLRNEKNLGPFLNWEYCLQLAKGDYLALFHADDIYGPDILEKQVEYLEAHPKSGAVFTKALRVGRPGTQYFPEEYDNPESWNREFEFMEVFKTVLKYYNYLVGPSVLVRTKIYQEEVVTYNYDKFGVSGDLWMWLRILENHTIGLLPAPLMTWRESTTQWSTREKTLSDKPHGFFAVIDHYLAMPEIKDQLDDEDFANLELLKMVDQFSRGANSAIKDQKDQAKSLFAANFSSLFAKVLHRSPPWKPSRFYKWWIFGLAMNLLMKIPGKPVPKKILFKLMY